MASQMALLFTLIPFFVSFLSPQQANSDDVPMPTFAFSWLNENNNFTAGDTATVKVTVIGNYAGEKYEFPFNPNIIVDGKMGNSSFITGLSLLFDGSWSITFIPIMVGSFDVLITDEHFHVFDSSLHFLVNAGPMYPSAGNVYWEDRFGFEEIVAGTEAEVWILPKDAFGNIVFSGSEGSSIPYNFTLSASDGQADPVTLLNITQKGWNKEGYLSIEFVAITAGSLLLDVEIENQTLRGSPLSFRVNPGEIDVFSCTAKWTVETKYFQLFSTMEGFIHQHDRYGNLVSGLHAFDIEVQEKGTNLSKPVADLALKEIEPGVQSFSFSLDEPGSFMLLISDQENNTLISDMPYDFSVYIGYCDDANSIVNGTGLNDSVAGETSEFSVFLKDAYMYPSPVDLEGLQVQINRESDSLILQPTVQIKEAFGGYSSSGRPNHGAHRHGNTASDFNVTYKAEKSGVYEIRVFCGNIPLHGGNPFRKEVIPGTVNMSLSGVVKYDEKVPKMTKSKVAVRLVDSYYNPILREQSRLQLEIASSNGSDVLTELFSDGKDGTYTGSYLAKEVGEYVICALYDLVQFQPCPHTSVHDAAYFPVVFNDTVSVWEDESISFNVLENDHFSDDNASIIEYSKPDHGSLLQYTSLFRYTPYKGFYGNDSFSYTIVDMNGNQASGAVDLLILCRPPQFVAVPTNMEATEDLLSPKFGGFSGFKLAYSDLDENISITLSSKSGNVLLSPKQMQFFQPRWDQLSIQRDNGVANELKLVGCLDAVNFALQSIQYLGHEDFYGMDTIRVSAINRHGRNDIDIPIYVHPINDPPVINIPPFVILDEVSDGILIFRGKANNSHFIEDPDVLYFPGNRSSFRVMFSVEVSTGLVSTFLPAELVQSTEVKWNTTYQWQPVHSFVAISKQFLVKAKGIRFQGTLDNCNRVMEQLMYHEGRYGAVLIVTVNDLGNHGCYPNCDDEISMPLFAESTINIIQNGPISSLAAQTLGSAIIVESITVFVLGLLLMFYICKCLVILVRDKNGQKPDKAIELSKLQDSSKQTLAADSPDEGKPFTGYCSLSVLHRRQQSSSKRLKRTSS